MEWFKKAFGWETPYMFQKIEEPRKWEETDEEELEFRVLTAAGRSAESFHREITAYMAADEPHSYEFYSLETLRNIVINYYDYQDFIDRGQSSREVPMNSWNENINEEEYEEKIFKLKREECTHLIQEIIENNFSSDTRQRLYKYPIFSLVCGILFNETIGLLSFQDLRRFGIAWGNEDSDSRKKLENFILYGEKELFEGLDASEQYLNGIGSTIEVLQIPRHFATLNLESPRSFMSPNVMTGTRVNASEFRSASFYREPSGSLEECRVELVQTSYSDEAALYVCRDKNCKIIKVDGYSTSGKNQAWLDRLDKNLKNTIGQQMIEELKTK